MTRSDPPTCMHAGPWTSVQSHVNCNFHRMWQCMTMLHLQSLHVHVSRCGRTHSLIPKLTRTYMLVFVCKLQTHHTHSQAGSSGFHDLCWTFQREHPEACTTTGKVLIGKGTAEVRRALVLPAFEVKGTVCRHEGMLQAGHGCFGASVDFRTTAEGALLGEQHERSLGGYLVQRHLEPCTTSDTGEEQLLAILLATPVVTSRQQSQTEQQVDLKHVVFKPARYQICGAPAAKPDSQKTAPYLRSDTADPSTIPCGGTYQHRRCRGKASDMALVLRSC